MSSNHPKLRVNEVLRRTIQGKTELVCYQVTSGRGNALIEHARINDKKFARRIIRAVKAYDRISALIERYDSARPDGQKSGNAAVLHLVDEIRGVMHRVGKL